MSQNQWNYDELDNIFFKKTENEIECLREMHRGFSPEKGSNLGIVGQRIYKGNDSKFLKNLQECLNYEKPQNDIGDCYAEMIRIGNQPELISLNKLKTIDEQKEWKHKRDNRRQEIIRQEIVSKQKEENQKKKHLEWKKEQDGERIQRDNDQEDLKINQSPLSKHKRTVTFDLAKVSTTSTSQRTSQLNRYNIEKSSQFSIKLEKGLESPDRLTEKSVTTAASSNYRTLHTPSQSPTKRNREKISFSFAANNIMNSTNLNINNMQIDMDDFRSVGTASPDVKSRGLQMPGQSLFNFSNDRIISSSRNARVSESPMKKNQQCHESSQQIRMSHLMNEQYSAIQSKMINKN